MIKVKDFDKKNVVSPHVLKDKKISIACCEEETVEQIQEVTGDIYELRYLGIDAKYEFYLALEKEKVLGYSIVQKYFENYYMIKNKGKRRGEPALVYSLERKKGVGSLLFLVSSLEILKDYDIEVFRCETVKGNVFDRLCPKLGLNFVEKKDVFDVYELVLEKRNRESLECKIKEQLKAL